jgi:hypothetical protein
VSQEPQRTGGDSVRSGTTRRPDLRESALREGVRRRLGAAGAWDGIPGGQVQRRIAGGKLRRDERAEEDRRDGGDEVEPDVKDGEEEREAIDVSVHVTSPFCWSKLVDATMRPTPKARPL